MESGARQAVMWRRQSDGSSDLGALLPILSAFSSPILHTLLSQLQSGSGGGQWSGGPSWLTTQLFPEVSLGRDPWDLELKSNLVSHPSSQHPRGYVGPKNKA